MTQALTEEDKRKVLDNGLSPLNPFLFPDPPSASKEPTANKIVFQTPDSFLDSKEHSGQTLQTGSFTNMQHIMKLLSAWMAALVGLFIKLISYSTLDTTATNSSSGEPPKPAPRKNLPKAVVSPQRNTNASNTSSGKNRTFHAQTGRRTVLSAPTPSNPKVFKRNDKANPKGNQGQFSRQNKGNRPATAPKTTSENSTCPTAEKSSTFFSELYIPTAQAGFLCGKQGANIKNIQNKTSTRIAISNEANKSDHDAQSKVRIYATEQKCIDAAELIIMETLAKCEQIGSKPAATETKPAPRETIPGNGLFLEMRVPASECGIIIGEKGKTLNDIQAKTRTKIQITKQAADNSLLSVVRIMGDPSGIAAAECAVFKQLAKSNKLIEWVCTDIAPVVNPFVSNWDESRLLEFQKKTGTFIQSGHTTLVLKGFTDKDLMAAKCHLLELATSNTGRMTGKGQRRNANKGGK